MYLSTENEPIVFEHRRFTLGCIGFDGDSFQCELNTGFGLSFTVVPIADLFWREANKDQDKSGFCRVDETHLIIYDDWNSPHEIEAAKHIIDHLAIELQERKLQEREHE